MTRRLFVFFCGIAVFAFAHCTQAQTINISLNLQYNDSANLALGGNWELVAKTSGIHGIAAISAVISDINFGSALLQPGIGAAPIETQQSGTTVEWVYFQDLSTPASVVTQVGRGAGTPGNVPLDPLNDPAWNNVARIATGTFGATRPAFTTLGGHSTDGNVLSSSTAPFNFALDAAVTTIVRDRIVSDYNRNGTVDAADYVVWRKTLGNNGANLPADGNGNNVIDEPDYTAWHRGFGLSGGSTMGASPPPESPAAVPEPASAAMIIALLAGLSFNVRKRSTASARTTKRFLPALAILLPLLMCVAERAYALPRTWVGVNNDWVDNVNAGFWSPADEPDADDEAIFNTANAVNLGSNHTTIAALTMSGGIDLNTNGFDLDVNGLVQLVGANTNLFVGGSTSLLTADSITINNGADVELNGGTIQINEEAGNGILDINAGGELVGHGTLSMTDTVAANTTLIVNDGAITARRDPAVIFGPPLVGTLTMNATDADARIDLDGAGELGTVNVSRNQTLDVNIQLADIFNGTITMAQDSTLDMSNAWTLGAFATINVDNGAAGGLPAVPAGVATIAGATFSQNSGTITVTDTDGTLQFDAPFTMNGGTLVNNGHLIFNNDATINAAASFPMGVAGADLTVTAGNEVTINQTNINLDGNGVGTVISVGSGGTLNIDVTDYESDAATNAIDATINLDAGDIFFDTNDAEVVMDGVLNMHSNADFNAGWFGEPVDIGNDAGTLDADVNVTGESNAPAQFGASVDFNADADINVANGAELMFLTNSSVTFNTVNGVNNAEFTGSGRISFNGTVNVPEAVTLNMVGGTVDLDGSDAVGEFINIDAPMTINAANMSSFGKNNVGGGTNVLDINNSVNTGTLTVNLDDPTDEWTLNAQGSMNLFNDNTEATLLAGSDVNLNGTVSVVGDVRVTARVDIGSTATIGINTAGQPLRLAGGNNTDDPNTIQGGTISGVGQLGADTNKALHGFGTINTDIAFVGSSNLRATGGTLTITGDIVDVNILGTADNTGTLNVVNPWETDGGAGGSIGAVVLNGGVLQGGIITNDNGNGIQGHGTVNSRVINNSKIVATNGGTLLVQTTGNNNDWDGATNTGELEALSADLEMVDTTGPVPPVRSFGGSVRAINDNRVFANGFGLDFNPGSSLTLEDQATYRASSSTDIGGTVTIGAGADATIQVANNFFLTFETGSATTLNGDVTLINNNINIEQDATFSGSGALKIPDGSHMVADNQAEIGVLLDMQGAFRPGNFNGIGRVELLDMQMSNTSELFVELIGTSLNQFDRLVADGDVIVDGYLNIDIDEISPGIPFVPALGQTFNIITGNSVAGQFDFADVSGMPDGLAFHIAYLSNAVQLQVVNTPFFSADFDDDGDVDKTDLAIWQGAYDLNQLGDADGDNDSDGTDLLIWQRQFGSHPGPGAGSGSTVPEPTSLLLLLVGWITLATVRGRR